MEVGGNLSDVRDRRPLERRVACDSFISILEHVERLQSSFLASFSSFFRGLLFRRMDSRFDIEHGISFKEIFEKRLFEISIDNADFR